MTEANIFYDRRQTDISQQILRYADNNLSGKSLMRLHLDRAVKQSMQEVPNGPES